MQNQISTTMPVTCCAYVNPVRSDSLSKLRKQLTLNHLPRVIVETLPKRHKFLLCMPLQIFVTYGVTIENFKSPLLCHHFKTGWYINCQAILKTRKFSISIDGSVNYTSSPTG